MRHFYLIILVICSLLAGCDEGFPPLVSVEVTEIFKGPPYTKTWKLNEAQLKQFELWLHERKSEGGPLFVTPLPPSFVILLIHANGSRSSLDLFSAENWKHKVIVNSSGKTRVENISPAEREWLLQLVKEMLDS